MTPAVRELYDRLHVLEKRHGVSPQTLATCLLTRAVLAGLEAPVGDGASSEVLQQILSRLSSLESQGVRLMATMAEISQELDDIKTRVDAAAVTAQESKDLIQALKDQIAAGGVATQADVDAIDAKADAILASLTPPTP
jgi:hypothetical protein